MKFTCLQENLEKALSLINRTAIFKSQLPITTNVFLKATKEGIEIVGTDLENTTRVVLLGKIEKEGGILLPIRTFIETVNALPKENVTIEVAELAATITSGRYKVKINGISEAEFPQLPKAPDKKKMEVGELLSYSKIITFAASSDESRGTLTGILVISSGKDTMLVATDGYRLSLKKIKGERDKGEGESEEEKIIIPSRVFAEVAKIAGERGKSEEGKEEVSLVIKETNNQVVFAFKDVEIHSRLIEGEFPAYGKIIPQSFETRAVFDREEFTKAVKLSSIFARDSANIVKVKIGKESMILSANATQVGENTCEVEAAIEGDENEIAFNSRFLLEFLAAIDSKEIAFEMTGPLNPGVFKIPGDDSYFHIIMPVRVQG